MALTDSQIDEYLRPLEPQQADSVRLLRQLILEADPTLNEHVGTDKWWGGLLTYTTPNGTPIYALGPRSGGKSTLHMMPYYCSTVFHERHGAALKKFLSGKSCVMFMNASDLPLDAIKDICTSGSAHVAQAMAVRDEALARKPKKKA